MSHATIGMLTKVIETGDSLLTLGLYVQYFLHTLILQSIVHDMVIAILQPIALLLCHTHAMILSSLIQDIGVITAKILL